MWCCLEASKLLRVAVTSLNYFFSTATLALPAQSQHLTNIATNIANAQTNAYRALGSFSHSDLVSLFKLALARFPAPNNLEAINGNFFKADPQAGTLELQSLGSVTGIAQVLVGASEQSNVDIAGQFTKMIVTQLAYSSSATVLKTADEMTQQARDLKR